MKAFNVLRGVAVPLLKDNIDTDQICPKQHLKRLVRTGFDRALFSDRRFDTEGSERPDFILNQDPWRKAAILVAGENFGCGSSREHAVWALVEFGIRCVIAPSFGDIFFQNSVNSGLLAVCLSLENVKKLGNDALAVPGTEWTIDLPNQKISTADGEAIEFDIDQSRKSRLIEGLDEIGMTLLHQSEIEAFEVSQRNVAPWLWHPAHPK